MRPSARCPGPLAPEASTANGEETRPAPGRLDRLGPRRSARSSGRTSSRYRPSQSRARSPTGASRSRSPFPTTRTTRPRAAWSSMASPRPSLTRRPAAYSTPAARGPARRRVSSHSMSRHPSACATAPCSSCCTPPDSGSARRSGWTGRTCRSRVGSSGSSARVTASGWCRSGRWRSPRCGATSSRCAARGWRRRMPLAGRPGRRPSRGPRVRLVTRPATVPHGARLARNFPRGVAARRAHRACHAPHIAA